MSLRSTKEAGSLGSTKLWGLEGPIGLGSTNLFRVHQTVLSLPHAAPCLEPDVMACCHCLSQPQDNWWLGLHVLPINHHA